MKVFAILVAAGVGALGWVFFDVNSSRIAWATMVGIITLLLLFVRQGQTREPLLRLSIALTVILTAFTSTVLGDDRPQLGLDLQGGVSIVLFPVDGSDLSLLDTAVDTISSRVAGLGASEPEVSRQGDTIVVDIPGLKDPQRAIEIVGRTACLRFRLVSAGPVPAEAVQGAPTTTVAATTTTVAGATTTTGVSGTTTAGTSTTVASPTSPTSTTQPATDGSAEAAGVTLDTVPVAATRPRQTTTIGSSSSTETTSTETTGSDSIAGTTTTLVAPTTTTAAAPKLNCDVSSAATDSTLPPDFSIPTDLSIPTSDEVPTPTEAVTPGSTAPSETDSSTAEAAGLTLDTVPVAAARPRQTTIATTTTVAPTTLAPTTTVTPTSTVAPTTTAGGSTTIGATTTTGPAATTTTIPEGTNICESLVGDDDPDGSSWIYDKSGENCYQVGPTILTGRAVDTASSRFDQSAWVVEVTFDNDDFVNLVATPYVGQNVAIVLDDKVQSAPTINEGITGRDVQITGDFTEKEADDLALVLRYGSLPVQFDESETTQQTVSPSLGKDQLRAGIAAGVIGLALVALYMFVYYRLLGLVVWFGLSMTALIFFTLVTFLGNSDSFGLSLTLAGVTGLIVSVGVTVDSYVVFFERLKDEVRSGKTIRSSLESGFTRAFRTIVAADLVSLIGAAVLYSLAAGSVKGFAFFLGLSTIIDLFVAYFIMYPVVWFLGRNAKLVRTRPLGIASGLDVAGKVDV